MDRDKSSKKERETLIEDKLKKILFGSKGSTVKDDRSSQGKEYESISDNFLSKEYFTFYTEIMKKGLIILMYVID